MIVTITLAMLLFFKSLHCICLDLSGECDKKLRDWASQVALVVKNLSASAGDMRDVSYNPESGRSPGRGHGDPLQCSCLENPHGQRIPWASVHGVAKSWTWLKRHRMHAYCLIQYISHIWKFKFNVKLFFAPTNHISSAWYLPVASSQYWRCRTFSLLQRVVLNGALLIVIFSIFFFLPVSWTLYSWDFKQNLI